MPEFACFGLCSDSNQEGKSTENDQEHTVWEMAVNNFTMSHLDPEFCTPVGISY
jgi:hypothetical protein